MNFLAGVEHFVKFTGVHGDQLKYESLYSEIKLKIAIGEKNKTSKIEGNTKRKGRKVLKNQLFYLIMMFQLLPYTYIYMHII